jgi:uncharacterized protein
MRSIDAHIAAWPPRTFAVIGSSLGGFYATCIAEQHGCPAVLLNPAIHPARDLAPYVGEQTAYHDPSERFTFHRHHLDELEVLSPPAITRPERYLVVIAVGDELLDWRETSARYAGARQHIVEGSDHALSDFEDHLPLVLDFLNLDP